MTELQQALQFMRDDIVRYVVYIFILYIDLLLYLLEQLEMIYYLGIFLFG